MEEKTWKSNIKNYLMRNFSVLEDIIKESEDYYFFLKDNKKKFPQGNILYQKNFKIFFNEVKTEIDNFFELKEVPKVNTVFLSIPNTLKETLFETLKRSYAIAFVQLPGGHSSSELLINASLSSVYFGYKTIKNFDKALRSTISNYNPNTNLITIADYQTVPAVGTIAHEYTHHLQYSYMDKILPFDKLIEGHARGIEGIVSKKYAEKFSNPNYEYDYFTIRFGELLSCYFKLCGKERIVPHTTIAKFFPKEKFSAKYDYSVATLSIAEKKHGEQIYKDILKDDFSFLFTSK